ncbi:MAG: transcription termination factor Rho, partial [Salinivenus sp.]
MSDNEQKKFERLLELIGDKKYGFMRELRPDLPKDDDDPFMPPPLIRKFNLRDGVIVEGDLKPGRKGGMQVGWIDSVMGMPPGEWAQLKTFDHGASI